MCEGCADKGLRRRGLVVVGLGLLAAATLGARAQTPPQAAAASPEAALSLMTGGNARYAANEPRQRDFSPARANTAQGNALPGHIAGLVQAMKPGIEPILKQPGSDLEQRAVVANVRYNVERLKTAKPILADLVAKKQLHGSAGWATAGGAAPGANPRVSVPPHLDPALLRSSHSDLPRPFARIGRRAISEELSENA